MEAQRPAPQEGQDSGLLSRAEPQAAVGQPHEDLSAPASIQRASNNGLHTFNQGVVKLSRPASLLEVGTQEMSNMTLGESQQQPESRSGAETSRPTKALADTPPQALRPKSARPHSSCCHPGRVREQWHPELGICQPESPAISEAEWLEGRQSRHWFCPR